MHLWHTFCSLWPFGATGPYISWYSQQIVCLHTVGPDLRYALALLQGTPQCHLLQSQMERLDLWASLAQWYRLFFQYFDWGPSRAFAPQPNISWPRFGSLFRADCATTLSALGFFTDASFVRIQFPRHHTRFAHFSSIYYSSSSCLLPLGPIQI